MKDKILNTIYEKLCTGFKTNFMPRVLFERELSVHYDSLLKTLVNYTETYYGFKNSKKKKEYSKVVKITKDEFIIDKYNKRQSGYSKQYTIKDLDELKKHHDFEHFEKTYDDRLKNEQEDVVHCSFFDFLLYNCNEFISSKEGNELSIEYEFWTYIHNTYLGNSNYRSRLTDEIVKTPDRILEKFKEYYLSNKYLILLDLAEKNLADENLSGFETYIINVGTRSYGNERAGWATITHNIINNDKNYSFSNSLKDEKAIRGECINIFIFQNKYLIKIAITLSEQERTPYIIQRDCEKVSLKNECEIVIAKHHGNETIIFDTRKDALEFQTKLIEIREGRKNK